MIHQDNDKQPIKLSYVTHFYCNQKSIESVFSLLRKYENLPLSIRSAVEFIIVDDGSPITYDIGSFDLNITWLKITEDIKWNQAGARNLGVTYAKSDKILLTDLDHELPAETFEYLINARNPGRNFYKIYRTSPEQGRYKGHSNLFFMSRARFFRHFGYDEEFAGNYGAEDYRFVKYHKYHGSRQKYLPKKIICHERVLDREKSYHSLSRDLSANTPVDLQKRKECETYGDEYGHSRIFLNFEWKIIYRHSVFPTTLPAEKRWWKPLWWLRYLSSTLSR
ncbi:glycosyltransferase family A protein [Edwardsiella anguillarum]|uniref:glycosyltransferase family A protein n=1 Tax=Edwardsiella anguillarum TaxID=1821960 RepID=UPI001FD6DE76|nr:glycosyltransferase family A protein [Edwardsiella anguillarum]UOU79048.1 glycosyltransferase [Edwardsiella anguillarum]